MQADLEKGYTRIANELLEELSLLGLSGREFRILLTIIRKTYGYQKKVDWISLDQIEESTGILKVNVSKVLTGLEKRKVIIKEGSGYVKKVGMNTNISDWSAIKQIIESDNGDTQERLNIKSDKLSNPITKSIKSDKTIIESDNGDTQIRQPQKKETITKEKKENINVDFEKLWKSFSGRFGDKGAKQKALTEFKKIKPDNNLFADMLRAIFDQENDKDLKNSQNQFFAPFQHVERWIKNRRWEDEINTELARPNNKQNSSRSERNDDSLAQYLAELGEQGGDCEGMENTHVSEPRYIGSGRH